MLRLVACLLPLAVAACHTTPALVTDAHAPPLDRVVRVFETASGREISLAQMTAALARADVVFLGETHLDDVTHRVEAAIHDALLVARNGRVVLAMEMFTTDAQPHLDAYVSGSIGEPAFLARANPWGNYATGYRPLVERARAARTPIVGSNAPQELARRIAAGGAAAFAGLNPEERALLPDALLPNSAAYWQRFDRATRGHAGIGAKPDPDRLLYSVQSIWDNTMGWSCARALERWPGHLVLHVNGGFHSAHGEGTAGQLAQRRPDAKILTVSIETAAEPAAVTFDPREADGDYIVVAAARARGLDEGTHAVTAHREQRYRLLVPLCPQGPLPLLIWLPGDGVRSQDASGLWRAALGQDVAVAVLEPSFGQVESDLSRGGRWFWADTFRDDVATASATIEEVREYVRRYWPIDATRIVVAGEGTGATVAVAAALWGDGAAQTVLAFEPRGHRKLAEQGLPESAARVAGLRIFAGEADRGFWEAELQAHGHRALRGEVLAPADTVDTVRAALGLEAPGAAREARLLVLPATSSALGRLWQQTALATARRGGPVTALAPADVASGSDGRVLLVAGEDPATEAALGASGVRGFTPREAAAALPRAPGAFGGTTILVVPASCPPEVREAWRAVAAANPMARHGRFFRFELAFEDEAPRLADVFAAMVAARRRNALVVPARFCATPAAMQALAEEAAAFADAIDVTWVPGLGAGLGQAPQR